MVKRCLHFTAHRLLSEILQLYPPYEVQISAQKKYSALQYLLNLCLCFLIHFRLPCLLMQNGKTLKFMKKLWYLQTLLYHLKRKLLF